MSQALRTSLIWHDEVMADVVHERPAPVTLGTTSDATFTTPELGLPPAYAIVTPGRRGYVLTLSAQMSGTICLGGVEHDVAAFVAAGDDPAGFRGTPIGGDDWGVIALDGRSGHKLFFQFVPHETEDWNLGHPMILAGLGGYALSIAALTAFWWNDGVALGEAAFRAASLASLAIGLAAIVRWAFKQDTESRASLAFSVLLHTAVLFATFQLYDRADPDLYPGPKSLTGEYLVKLSDPPPEIVPPAAKTPTITRPAASVVVAKRDPTPLPPAVAPWKRPKKPTLVPSEQTGEAGTGNRGRGPGVLAQQDILKLVVADRGLQNLVDDLKSIGGPGGGTGNAPGAPGPSTKGGPKPGQGPIGERTEHRALETGPLRAAVCMGAGCNGGREIELTPPHDPPPGEPTLSKAEINAVMQRHKGLFQACYQKALDRSGPTNGELVVSFVIGADGRVKSTRTDRASVGGDVPACIKQKLTLLRFPAKGGATVIFPFSFSNG